MKGLLSIIFIVLVFNLMLFSQSETAILKGRVIDQENSEGIAFVSIGIEGTFTGAASNADGYFELRVPEEHKSKILFFSAIGYKNASFAISEMFVQPEILIRLFPQSYDIDAVDIAAESRVLYRILRTASERVPQNYHTVPLNLKLYYEKRKLTDMAASIVEKSIIDLYDAKAYQKPSWADAYKSRSYRTTEVQRSSPAFSFRNSSNRLDELLEMDITRLSNSILNPKLLSGFQLRMEANTIFDGDSVWIISYEAKKLDVAHTGSFYPTSYKGKIYIAQSDYAVLRNEIHLTEAKACQQGRSLAVRNNPDTNIQMNITAGYKKVLGKYVLAFVDSEKQFTSDEKQSVYESGKLIVLETDTKNNRVITGRDYFTKAEPNTTFWNNFILPSR